MCCGNLAKRISLRKDVLRLMPSRFEIGPVYTTNPSDRKTLRKSSAFKPVAKELCFDIDLTDYDDIRTCCDKANICNKCWQFITMAIKVVDVALRDDFGFKHIMWVYSGRRGAHAWVCDKEARQMDDQRRRAIAGYLEVIKGGAQSGKKVNVKRPLHPHVAYVLSPVVDRLAADSAIGAVSKHLSLISRPTSLKTKTLGHPLKSLNVFSSYFQTELSTTLCARNGIQPLDELHRLNGRI
jgi:predicted DNA primase small subunit